MVINSKRVRSLLQIVLNFMLNTKCNKSYIISTIACAYVFERVLIYISSRCSEKSRITRERIFCKDRVTSSRERYRKIDFNCRIVSVWLFKSSTLYIFSLRRVSPNLCRPALRCTERAKTSQIVGFLWDKSVSRIIRYPRYFFVAIGSR